MKRFDLELRVLLALAVANGIGESSIVPLLPSIRDGLGLSPVETGLIWTTTTLAMLIAAVPVGYAANRIGSRVPLLVAAGSDAARARRAGARRGACDVLAARLLFGLSFGILWVIGPARAAAGDRGAGGTGPLIAAAGIGWLVGPVVAGSVADASDWRVASAVLAVLTLPIVPVVYRYAAPRLSRRARRQLSPARRLRPRAPEPDDCGAALVSALLGVVGGASNVLVPLALDARRAVGGKDRARVRDRLRRLDRVVDARRAAARLRRHPPRHRRDRGGAGRRLAAAGAAADRPSLLVAFLVVSTSCRATVNALNYAVGVRATLGDTAPLVVGVLNLAWAVMALVSPLLAGLAEGSSSVRIAFAVTGLVAAAVALVLLGPRLHFRSARAVSSVGRAGDS